MNKFHFVLGACLLVGAMVLAGACKGNAGGQSSPTEAYKTLYAAVKRKDSAGIKKVLSKATIEFMTAAAQMQKKTFDEVIANGLSESTFSPTLPQLCQERVKGNMGGLEVKRTDGKWEDLPFIQEDGEWKLAVGDLFKGTWQKPGDTLCMKPEQMPTIPPSTSPMPNAPGGPPPANTNSSAPVPAPRSQPGTTGAPAPIKPPTKTEPSPGK
jgi:hypothetical protein